MKANQNQIRKKLFDYLSQFSVDQTPYGLKSEWKVREIHHSRLSYDCPCGHENIKLLCVIENIHTHKDVVVGCVCVTNFIEEGVLEIAKSILELKTNPNKTFSIPVLDFLAKNGVINKKDYDFMSGIFRKRKLSTKQIDHRTRLNKRISNYFFIKDAYFVNFNNNNILDIETKRLLRDEDFKGHEDEIIELINHDYKKKYQQNLPSKIVDSITKYINS